MSSMFYSINTLKIKSFKFFSFIERSKEYSCACFIVKNIVDYSNFKRYKRGKLTDPLPRGMVIDDTDVVELSDSKGSDNALVQSTGECMSRSLAQTAVLPASAEKNKLEGKLIARMERQIKGVFKSFGGSYKGSFAKVVDTIVKRVHRKGEYGDTSRQRLFVEVALERMINRGLVVMRPKGKKTVFEMVRQAFSKKGSTSTSKLIRTAPPALALSAYYTASIAA